MIQLGSVVQNGPGMPMKSERAVDDAGRAVEEDEDHDPDRDRRHDVGEVEDGPENAGRKRKPRQDQREAERDAHLRRHRHHRVDERVLQRGRDLRVVQQLAVVVEADPARRLDPRDLLHAVVGEGEVEARDHRACRQRDEPDRPRQDEQVCGPRLPLAKAGEPATGPRGRARRFTAGDACHAACLTWPCRSLPVPHAGPGRAPGAGSDLLKARG